MLPLNYVIHVVKSNANLVFEHKKWESGGLITIYELWVTFAHHKEGGVANDDNHGFGSSRQILSKTPHSFPQMTFGTQQRRNVMAHTHCDSPSFLFSLPPSFSLYLPSYHHSIFPLLSLSLSHLSLSFKPIASTPLIGITRTSNDSMLPFISSFFQLYWVECWQCNSVFFVPHPSLCYIVTFFNIATHPWALDSRFPPSPPNFAPLWNIILCFMCTK